VGAEGTRPLPRQPTGGAWGPGARHVPRPRSGPGMPSAPGMLMPATPARGWEQSPLRLQSTQHGVLPAPGTALGRGRLGLDPLSPSWPIWQPRAGAPWAQAPPSPPPVPPAGTGPARAGGAPPSLGGLHHPKNAEQKPRETRCQRCHVLLPLGSARFQTAHGDQGAPIPGVPSAPTSGLSQPPSAARSRGGGVSASRWQPRARHSRDTAGAGCRGWGCRALLRPGRQIRVAQATGTEKARLDRSRRGAQGCLFSVLSG